MSKRTPNPEEVTLRLSDLMRKSIANRDILRDRLRTVRVRTYVKIQSNLGNWPKIFSLRAFSRDEVACMEKLWIAQHAEDGDLDILNGKKIFLSR